MIVKNESGNLNACLSSIRPYVDELIIVDTGSADDGATKKIALSHGAQVFDFNPTTHPESFMMDDETSQCPPPYTKQMMLADFGAARNFAFSKSTMDFNLWIDADDTVTGADKLAGVLETLGALPRESSAWFRYDYSFHDGRPICQLWRERLIRRGSGKWLNPIHEIHEMAPGTQVRHFNEVVITHHRDSAGPRNVVHRNYKVLKRKYDAEIIEGKPDPRTLFYLGNESRHLPFAESIGYYEQYLRVSGWAEERGMARMFLGQLYEAQGDAEAAFKSYTSATVDFPTNPDAWFSLGRLSYAKDDWGACVQRMERGFAIGSPNSTIMYNELDRSYTPHLYYNLALSKIGRTKDAIKSCDAGLSVRPNDSNLKFNRQLYVDYLAAHPEPQAPTIGGLENEKLPTPVLVSLAMRLWTQLVKFDELVKARDFLDSLPYALEDDFQLQDAKRKTEELLAFLDSDQKLKAYYATHEANEAHPVELPFPEWWPQHQRLEAVVSALGGRKKLRILDLGCQDGWMSNRLSMLGHDVVGLDFSEAHLKIARTNAIRLDLDTTFVEGFISELEAKIIEKFDVVICTEVIEHIEKLEPLFESIKRKLKPEGTLVLTTPRGAWLDGQQITIRGNLIGGKWDEPREHIRAFTAHGLQTTLGKHFRVESCYPIPMTKPDVPNQAALFAICTKHPVKPKRPRGRELDVVFWIGQAVEWWNPASINTTGIGGSETACVRLANELARLGHKVRVYSDCPNAEGFYDGVDYFHFGKFNPAQPCDVFISSRQPHIGMSGVKAKAKFLWIHDIHVGGANAGLHQQLLKFDRLLCLSNWHRDYVLSLYPFIHPNTVLLTRNGIDLKRFTEPLEKKKNKLIYASSPDRGLDILLDLLPRIADRVPDVELNIYYGFKSWENSVGGNPEQLALITYYKKRIAEAKNTVFHGRVNQKTLAAAYQASKVWAHPTEFTETSCISAMEAQAAGCVPVTTRLGALAETVKHGVLINPSARSKEYQDVFVDTVCTFLLNEDLRAIRARAGMEHAKTLGWDSLAVEWEEMFHRVLEEVKVDLVGKYNEVA